MLVPGRLSTNITTETKIVNKALRLSKFLTLRGGVDES